MNSGEAVFHHCKCVYVAFHGSVYKCEGTFSGVTFKHEMAELFCSLYGVASNHLIADQFGKCEFELKVVTRSKIIIDDFRPCLEKGQFVEHGPFFKCFKAAVARILWSHGRRGTRYNSAGEALN